MPDTGAPCPAGVVRRVASTFVVAVGSALLLLGGLVLAITALPVGSAQATTAAPAPGPPVVGTGSSNLFTAAAVPCAAPAGGTTCTTEPTSVEATWPFLNTGISGIEVTWTPPSTRPAAAPAPQQLTVALPVSSATCNGAGDDCTWPWPSLLEPASPATVLNGTYQVVACGGSPVFGPACQSGSPYQAVGLAEGVAPAAPSAVKATVSGTGVVSLSWPAGPEADLAGYEVTAVGGGKSRLVGACTLNGAPAATADAKAGPCPSPLAVTDQPGAGSWTYDVTALRYGTDGTAATLVPSAATAAPATVTAAEVAAGTPPAPSGSGAGSASASSGSGATAGSAGSTGGSSTGAGSAGAPGGGFVLPAVPVLPTRAESTPLAQAPVQAAVPVTSAPTTVAPDTGFSSSLPFAPAGSDQPVAVASAAAPGLAEPGPPRGVGGWAAFAAGLLVLAVAAHLLYLRAAVARYRRTRPPRAVLAT